MGRAPGRGQSTGVGREPEERWGAERGRCGPGGVGMVRPGVGEDNRAPGREIEGAACGVGGEGRAGKEDGRSFFLAGPF